MKRIAYFHIFGGPPIESSVATMLRDAFPEYVLDDIEVMQVVRRSLPTTLVNTVASLGALREPSLRELKRAFIRTPYLFDAVRRLARRHLQVGADTYAFTFQLQSLFDTSAPGIPNFVYTDHTHLANLHYPGFDRSDLNSPRWIERERQIYANATHLFTRSSNITRSLIDDYGCAPDKISCVGVGTNTAAPEQPASPGGGKRILFVGSDWERKGGPMLAAAFERVRARHPDATLTVVGCQPELGPGAEALGKIPIAEVGDYYRDADLFCLPTTNEPFGVVLVEAMSYGLPIVATRVGAVPDLVKPGRNGELVEVGDVEGLAQTIGGLLDQPATLQRYGQSSLAVVASRYNWPSVGRAVRAEIIKHLPAQTDNASPTATRGSGAR